MALKDVHADKRDTKASFSMNFYHKNYSVQHSKLFQQKKVKYFVCLLTISLQHKGQDDIRTSLTN